MINKLVKNRIGAQILREFWIQILLSIGWGTYKTIISNDPNKISVFITNFMASLFLLSWMMGQFIRVKKQQKVEDELGHVKNELTNLLTKIEIQSKELIGNISGGDSIAYLHQLGQVKPLTGNKVPKLYLMLANDCDYPVFDFKGYWTDLDEPIDFSKGGPWPWTKNAFNFGDLYPHTGTGTVLTFDMTNKEKRRINLFAQTRNRSITQEFVIVKVGFEILVAFRVTSRDFNFIQIPDDFPGYDGNNADEIFAFIKQT